MIDAKELRIGNWLIANNAHDKNLKYGQVTHVFMAESGGYTVDYHYPGSWFDPIPLTPEILMKCEFGFSYRTVFHDNSGYDHYCKAGRFRVVIYENGECEYDKFTRFKYLHQLQNLYYAITQTELNYKP